MRCLVGMAEKVTTVAAPTPTQILSLDPSGAYLAVAGANISSNISVFGRHSGEDATYSKRAWGRVADLPPPAQAGSGRCCGRRSDIHLAAAQVEGRTGHIRPNLIDANPADRPALIRIYYYYCARWRARTKSVQQQRQGGAAAAACCCCPALRNTRRFASPLRITQHSNN